MLRLMSLKQHSVYAEARVLRVTQVKTKWRKGLLRREKKNAWISCRKTKVDSFTTTNRLAICF